MKRYAYLLWALAPLLAAACGDNSEVFYSVSYPIVRIDASVKGADSTTPDDGGTSGSEDGTSGSEGTDGTTGTDDGTGSIPDGTANGSGTVSDGTGTDSDSDSDTGSGSGSGSEEPAENPLFTEIAAEIVAQAPVKAGGSYRLDFSKYNRGRAPIDTATDAGQVVGVFIKEPGSDDIRFYFLDQDYVCTRSSYKDENGRDMTCFKVDLTAEYQERYPDAGITEALRVEYTSTPY